MEQFLRKIEDLYNRSKNKNIITCTSFLTPAEQQLIKEKFSFANVRFIGGINEAERVRVFFLPDYIDEIDSIKEHIKVFRVDFFLKLLF